MTIYLKNISQKNTISVELNSKLIELKPNKKIEIDTSKILVSDINKAIKKFSSLRIIAENNVVKKAAAPAVAEETKQHKEAKKIENTAQENTDQTK